MGFRRRRHKKSDRINSRPSGSNSINKRLDRLLKMINDPSQGWNAAISSSQTQPAKNSSGKFTWILPNHYDGEPYSARSLFRQLRWSPVVLAFSETANTEQARQRLTNEAEAMRDRYQREMDLLGKPFQKKLPFNWMKTILTFPPCALPAQADRMQTKSNLPFWLSIAQLDSPYQSKLSEANTETKN